MLWINKIFPLEYHQITTMMKLPPKKMKFELEVKLVTFYDFIVIRFNKDTYESPIKGK